jgi:CheY-like chemotaxis protein
VVTTTNGFEALRILAEEPCQAVLSDMRMPLLNGARFLTLARQHAPETVRLLLTGQSTIDDAVAAVNDGEIFRFLIKPCGTRDLIAALDQAVTRYQSLVSDRDDREQTVRGTIDALTRLAAAIDPDGPARAAYIRREAVALAAGVDGAGPQWELERACELMQVGVVALPAEIRAELAPNRSLSPRHRPELERLPELAAPFLHAIPRLSPVAALLAAAGEPLVPRIPGVAGTPPAARVLRIALDYALLERDGVSVDSALHKLQSRSGRYDAELLTTFAGLVQGG